MALRIRGDLGRLEDLLESFHRLASPDFKAALVVDLAEATITLLLREFATGRDPSGKPWPPPKRGDNLPMIRTGKLMTGFSYKPGPDGFEIQNTQEYSGYLQDGTSRMAPRKMLPDDGEWPPLWRLEYEQVVEKKLFEIAFR